MILTFETMDRSKSPGEKASEEGPIRVLVAEDDPDTRSMIQEALTMGGFSVTSTGEGIEADRIASEQRFDVVVSDIRMPGLDGMELARRLGARERPPRIILITAFPSPRTVELGYIAGAAQVLSKPFSLEKLTHLVGEIGRERRSKA
jgi:DNA-binding response OmpR family regulator